MPQAMSRRGAGQLNGRDPESHTETGLPLIGTLRPRTRLLALLKEMAVALIAIDVVSHVSVRPQCAPIWPSCCNGCCRAGPNTHRSSLKGTVMTQRIPAVGVVVVLAVLAYGCASIMHGTRQDLGVSSSPSGAQITVDGISHGKTPCVCKLTRKDNHVVQIELDGYQPYELSVTRKVSGWVWGNILFGGLIGLAVDAIDGALYNLNPDQVMANMTSAGVAQHLGDDAIVVAVVMEPDPAWQRIGQLVPVTN